MINNIQILRAFAAINVVVYHVLYLSSIYFDKINFLNFLKGWGLNGVDLFFVISGFIIFHTQLNNKKNIYQFIKSRLARVVPSYWIITLFYAFLYFLFPNLFNNLTISSEKIFYSLFFFSQLIEDLGPIVNVGWTLEYEMLFYIMFSIFLFFKKFNIIYINIIFIILILLSKNFLFFEFLFGINIAYFYNKKNLNSKVGLLIFFIGLSILVLSLKPISIFHIDNDINRVFFWGIPSLLIVLGFIYCKPVYNKFLLFLGNASYSIYLVHFMVITSFCKIFYPYLILVETDFIVIILIFLGVSLSCLFYIFVEKPTLNFLKNKERK